MTGARDRADELVAALEPALPGRVERDAPLAGLTTYRVGGRPRCWCGRGAKATSPWSRRRCADIRPPLLILGRGSNLLIADRGFPGLALLLEGEFEEITSGEGSVRAGGAVALPVLARQTAAAGLAGLEFYVGIPGTVGGAVRMNAGGHGRETREVLRSRPGRRPRRRRPRRRPPVERPRPRVPALGDRARPTSSPARRSTSKPTRPPRARRASARSCGGAASTSPAAPTPDRCSATRPVRVPVA